ncbi:MAG: hypothetical protein ACR2PC_10535, partial [Tsuneonella suprasediminis]
MRAVSIKTVLTIGCAMGALAAMPTAAAAQDQTADEGTSVTSAPADQVTSPGQNAIIVTGSRIKQDPTKSSLPLQVITTK